jgi:hypothetical protein
MVEAQIEEGGRGESFWGFENTDAEGRFVLKNCIAGSKLRVTARHTSTFPQVVLHGIEPGGEELVIRLPKWAPIWIQGSVTDPDGKALPNVHASPFMTGGNGSPAETVDPTTGAFRYGPYPPGEYSLNLSADGYPVIRLPWRKLGPDEVWDVGALRFEAGGALEVALIAASAAPTDAHLAIRDPQGNHVEQVEARDGMHRAGPLRPGDYVLHVSGASIAAAAHPFVVRAGVTTRLDVPLQVGTPTTITCALPAGVEPAHGAEVAVRDARGGIVARATAWQRAGRTTATFGLLPGSYRVEATKDGCRGEAAFDVPAAAAAPVAVTVTLRRE